MNAATNPCNGAGDILSGAFEGAVANMVGTAAGLATGSPLAAGAISGVVSNVISSVGGGSLPTMEGLGQSAVIGAISGGIAHGVFPGRGGPEIGQSALGGAMSGLPGWGQNMAHWPSSGSGSSCGCQ